MIYLGDKPIGVSLPNPFTPPFFKKIDSGSVTPTENFTGTMHFNHSLGEKPLGVILFTTEGSRQASGESEDSLCFTVMIRNEIYDSNNVGLNNCTYCFKAGANMSAYRGYGNSIGITNWWNNTRFSYYTANTIGQLLAGRTYHWIAWA